MILYIQTAFLGDLLLSIPTLKYLRKIYPEKQIHLLCRKELASFFLETKLVDHVYTDYQGKKPTWRELKSQLDGNTFDLLICPHESFRSAWIAAHIHAKIKIGFYKWWNGIVFNQRELRPLHWPEVLRQLSLVGLVDIELNKKLNEFKNKKAPFDFIPDWTSMKVNLNSSNLQKSKIEEKWKIPSQKKWIALAPGSVWATKKWGDDNYKNLAIFLAQKEMAVILLGSSSERELGEYVQNQNKNIFNLCGETSLYEMAEILNLCETLVCNDSGAMHMASVADCTTLAFFGPTVPAFGYQPWNPKAQVLEIQSLPCRPCSPHGTKECPIGTHECMKKIGVLDVVSRIF